MCCSEQTEIRHGASVFGFCGLIFGLALVLYFLAMFPSLCFEMVMYIQYIESIKSDFDFHRGITVRRLPCISEETLDFETSLKLLQTMNGYYSTVTD